MAGSLTVKRTFAFRGRRLRVIAKDDSPLNHRDAGSNPALLHQQKITNYNVLTLINLPLKRGEKLSQNLINFPNLWQVV